MSAIRSCVSSTAPASREDKMTVDLFSDSFCFDAVRLAVDVALKGTLLVLFAWALTAVLRRGSAHLRGQVWTFALIGLAVIPLLAAGSPLWRWPLLPDLLDLSAMFGGTNVGAAVWDPVALDPVGQAGSVEEANP